MFAVKPKAAGFDPFHAACSSPGLGSRATSPRAKEGLREPTCSDTALHMLYSLGFLGILLIDGKEQYCNSRIRCAWALILQGKSKASSRTDWWVAVVGAGWCTHSPCQHCHAGPAMPEQSHLLWGAEGPSPGQENEPWSHSCPQCSLSWAAPARLTRRSVIQTENWSSHQGQVYFFFWKSWSLLFFLDCSATEHSECCMHQQGTCSAWAPTKTWTSRCHCQRITEKSRLWHQLCHQNPNPITADAKGLWFQTPRESRLFMV